MIELDSYHVEDAYAGIYAGADQVDPVRSARHRLEQIWGPGREAATLVEEPRLHEFELAPRRCMMAWLVTNEAPADSPDDHGAQLFVVWFANQPPHDPLMAALEIVARRGGWDKLAKGFCL